MSNFDSRTGHETHDRFKKGSLFDSNVAQRHIYFEFFSRLLE